MSSNLTGVVGHRSSKGQALIVGMGLMAVAIVVGFFIFNTSRAVNEKINIVNAADAAAYSGAQIAARQLNFIAYTNRVMLANEVAIGHMLSYQAEVDVFSDAVSNMGGPIGNVLQSVIDGALAYVGTDLEDIFDGVSNIAKVFTSSYIVGVSANNASYAAMQQAEYELLAGLDGGPSPVETAMNLVAQQYSYGRSGVSISVNSPTAVTYLRANGRNQLADEAENSGADLCGLVMFATPSAPGAGAGNGNGVGNGLRGWCKGQANGNGNGNGNGGPQGSFNNPAEDAGVWMTMMERTLDAVSNNANRWITDRNRSDDTVFFGLFGMKQDRTGGTSVQWDADENSYNWVASETMEVSTPSIPLIGSLFKMSGTADVDAATVAASPTIVLDRVLMAANGMCADTSCTMPTTYQQVSRYARVNPAMIDDENKVTAYVTAVVQQQGNCNDAYGLDDLGNEKTYFRDDQTRFGRQCNSDAILTAASRASVSYEQPATVNTNPNPNPGAIQLPNLFNPYWTAKLDYANTRPD